MTVIQDPEARQRLAALATSARLEADRSLADVLVEALEAGADPAEVRIDGSGRMFRANVCARSGRRVLLACALHHVVAARSLAAFGFAVGIERGEPSVTVRSAGPLFDLRRGSELSLSFDAETHAVLERLDEEGLDWPRIIDSVIMGLFRPGVPLPLTDGFKVCSIDPLLGSVELDPLASAVDLHVRLT